MSSTNKREKFSSLLGNRSEPPQRSNSPLLPTADELKGKKQKKAGRLHSDPDYQHLSALVEKDFHSSLKILSIQQGRHIYDVLEDVVGAYIEVNSDNKLRELLKNYKGNFVELLAPALHEYLSKQES